MRLPLTLISTWSKCILPLRSCHTRVQLPSTMFSMRRRHTFTRSSSSSFWRHRATSVNIFLFIPIPQHTWSLVVRQLTCHPQCSCGRWLCVLGGELLESGWVCLKAFRGFSCSSGDTTCGRFQLYFGTAALTHQCGGVRVVGTTEASERQEGFPPRHFFHPMTRIPIMPFTASCPVATNTVWTAPRFTQSLSKCLDHRARKKTRPTPQIAHL